VVAGKASTGLSEEEFLRCNKLMIRSMQDYKARSIEGEARVNVKQLANGLVRVFEDEKKLYPGTKAPVPAELTAIQKPDFRTTSADWQDPAWTCLSWDPSDFGRQRFQYEIKATPKKKSYEVIARGYPYEDGELVTLFMTVELAGKEAKVSELQRR